MSYLEKSILTLIIYYDVFSYPLTLMEIWERLDMRCEMSEIQDFLNNFSDKIEEQKGFYFLKGREELIETRLEKQKFGVCKWKKAMRVTKFLRFIPYIRMISLCNNNGFLNTRKDSDIDLFIIIKRGNIWLARFLITFCTHILKARRHGKKVKDRLCLSFYITDEAMNLRKFYDKGNIYLYQWMNLIAPIFDVGVYKDFFKVNSWIREFIPQAIEWETTRSAMVRDSGFSRNFRRFWERILDSAFGRFLNLGLKKIQLKKMMASKNSAIHEDNDKVVVNDSMMKFHERDLPMYEKETLLRDFLKLEEEIK